MLSFVTALLCIDRLGTKARWRSGGPEAAMATFDDFQDLVLDTVSTLDCADDVAGELDADWCALLCPTTEAALALGRRIFRRAWFEPQKPEDPRCWLRGVVAPAIAEATLRRREPDEELPRIGRTVFAPEVVHALAALRSGFRGMRLLVAVELLNDPLRGHFRIPLGRLGVIPFRAMNHTPYPPSLGRDWQDFLWMAETSNEWLQYAMRMKQRVLWSACTPEEFQQAAATQVVFHECDAILGSVLRKNQLRRHEEPDELQTRERP